jgi:prolyl-tRNA synthetase
MAAAIEQNHDDKGIVWPLPIAPYHIYLCPLYPENSQIEAAVEKLYADLGAQGLELLYDDRSQSPGVKFNDADLLGIPIRVTISPRSLEKGGAEIKLRWEKEIRLSPLADVPSIIKGLISDYLSTLPDRPFKLPPMV